MCAGRGTSLLLLYSTAAGIALLALSPFSVIAGVAYTEGIGVLAALELLIDEYMLYQNLAWPALCFLHLPVHVLCLHLVFG